MPEVSEVSEVWVSQLAIGPLGEPMSWERYLALPDELRAEYVDGRAIVSPPPSFGHQEICQRLRDVLRRELGSNAVIAVGAGWRLPGTKPRVRIPDLMLLAVVPAGDIVVEPPLVAVEVLSTNRSYDLVRKSTEYLHAGIAQYWIVDPRDARIDIFESADDGWRPLHQLTPEAPEATVDVPRYGLARLDLREILSLA